MALFRSGAADRIVGFDLMARAGEEGLARKAIHEAAPDLATAVDGADLVILAAPVERIPRIVKESLPYLKKGAILTDVASTKRYLAETIPPLLPAGVYYVGGHPMAGTERSGISAADPFLFENAVYLLTPGESTPQPVIDILLYMVGKIGGIPLSLTPLDHDIMVAAISHLPHLAAAALVNAAARVDEQHAKTLSLAAGGFRDSTRIALGSPCLWREIFASNRRPLLTVLDLYLEELNAFRHELRLSADEKVEARLERAAAVRRQLPVKNKGFLTLLHDLVVVIEDRPGAIAGVVSILAAANLNIKDIEILRIREGEGGTLRLAFEDAATLERAVDLLSTKGYQVQARGEG